jgi:hypothetical protein
MSLTTAGNLWVKNNVSAVSFTDRTPYPKDFKTALDSVMSMEKLPEGEYEEDNKTIKYNIWELYTKNYKLKCADKHIIFDKNLNEIYVENIKVGDDIITESGIEKVTFINETDTDEHMYDLELNIDSDKRYYTGGILSHNTTYIRYLLKMLKEQNNDNNILYFPPTMVDSIVEPSFINFISDWVTDSKGKNYLLIEDAEPLLEITHVTLVSLIY